jgi:sugar lactone lactonase YvrE
VRVLGGRTISTAAAVAALGLTCAGAAGATGAGGARHVPTERNQRALHRQLALRAYAKSPKAPNASAGHTPNDNDLALQQAQYDYERTAPSAAVSGQALISAARQAGGLQSLGGPWEAVTNRPYNGQPSNYTDPFWSNVGAGFSLVGGRTTALAQTPDGAWFAGTADGGVWRSSDQGRNWVPVFDSMPSLSIGALAVDPADGSLWVGTGEANTSQDSYAGTGVYRSADGGQTFQRVGDDAGGNNPLVSHTVFQIAFDSSGVAYAATNNGLFRFSPASGQWTEVLDPSGPSDFPPYDNQTTTVAVVPGTGGQDVITAIGWHGPGNTENNGFYASTDGGQTFRKVTPTGAINAGDIGRTTFAYSADGKKLYAIVQSPAMLAANKESVLQGIFVASGAPASVAGPWTKIGDEAKLAASGSALAVGSGYGVGIQAWYNQDLAVDPANDNHVYAGLEEVFESTDAGGHWVTASPYWNYGLACGTTCPNTTHPDQHAMMIADRKIVLGNDGGVYTRPLSDTQQYGDWSDLNATLASWQYYDARAGSLGGGGLGVWGGLQDNGTSVLASGSSQMAEPAGGDGFDVIVDPADANRMVGEYTDGTLYASTDGGHTFNHTNIAPGCVSQATYGMTPLANCDPGMRFVTPLVPDQHNANIWVTGGESVWMSKAGWKTTCTASTCTWQRAFDTGAGHAVTALSSAQNGGIIYAAWVAGGGNPGPSFASGIATNYGGRWHQINTAGLPDRYIAGMTVDAADPAHAYAIFNGYSRQWIPGGGVGHVYETWNGGRSWQDISGNLPDIASNAMVLAGHQLALATDLGMYTASEGQGAQTRWSRLGTGLPNASVDDVTPGPDGYIYAATHGRGIWRLAVDQGSRAQLKR